MKPVNVELIGGPACGAVVSVPARAERHENRASLIPDHELVSIEIGPGFKPLLDVDHGVASHQIVGFAEYERELPKNSVWRYRYKRTVWRTQ